MGTYFLCLSVFALNNDVQSYIYLDTDSDNSDNINLNPFVFLAVYWSIWTSLLKVKKKKKIESSQYQTMSLILSKDFWQFLGCFPTLQSS